MPYFNGHQLIGASNQVISLDATSNVTLTSADSGSVIYIPRTTASSTITLPAAKEGLNFKFILTGTPDGAAHTRTISSAVAGELNGFYIGVAAAPVMVSFTGKNSLILGATTANAAVGDYADFFCDGTSWYIRASTNGTASGWTAP